MKNRLKIALFIDTYFPMIDGVVMVVDNYAKRLQEYADVTVFCPFVSKEFTDNFNYKVVRCKSFKPFFLDYVAPIPQLDRKFKKFLKTSHFDIVHIHSPFGISSLGVKYARKNNIPVVATLHSQYKQDIQVFAKFNLLTNAVLAFLMKTFNKCDECWAVNEGMRQLYLSEYGLKVKSKTKPNASDFRPIKAKDETKREIRDRFGLNDNEKLLLFVGRINFIKNILFIVNALYHLKDQGFAFKMLFVGSGSDTENLKKQIYELGLDNEIILAGEISSRSELEKIYAASDLFLFPSLYDANSLVQIEAASQEVPTLFIRGAKTASSCIENQNAFMSENDPFLYSKKIIEIFKNEELYTAVSKNTQKELYSNWDDSIKELLCDYERIIENYHK